MTSLMTPSMTPWGARRSFCKNGGKNSQSANFRTKNVDLLANGWADFGIVNANRLALKCACRAISHFLKTAGKLRS
jgi:hypothetical protein